MEIVEEKDDETIIDDSDFIASMDVDSGSSNVRYYYTSK